MTKDKTPSSLLFPDHWHKQVVVDAVGAGVRMCTARSQCRTALRRPGEWSQPAKKTDRIVQIGAPADEFRLVRKSEELFAAAPSVS